MEKIVDISLSFTTRFVSFCRHKSKLIVIYHTGGRSGFVGRAGIAAARHVKDIGSGGSSNLPQYKYLTTVIPYQPEKGSPSLHGLQVLVKILKAINEDSPAVPALLTDYILKVLCPS